MRGTRPHHHPLRPASLAAFACVALAALGGGLQAAPGSPEVRTLPNGLTLVLLEDHAVPLAAVSLWVHAGSKDEIASSAGYAHDLEHLLQRGTADAGPFEYQKLANRWGGALSVRSNYDRTHITVTGSPDSLEPMVQAVGSMALRATLADEEIDHELGTLNQEMHTYYDEPSSVAFLEGMRATFEGHPYRFPMLGSLQALGTLKHDPLAAFYSNLYVPNNMALVIAGDFDPARAVELATAQFGSARRSVTLAPKPAPPQGFAGHKDIEKRLGLREPWVSLCFRGPGFRHPDRPAFELLARALGDAGGAPITAALRRDKIGGAARVVFYGLEDAGMLYVGVQPPTPQLSYDVATSALQEIVAFKKRGLKPAALASLRARVLLEERMAAEEITQRAERLGEAALFGGVRYYWDLPDVEGSIGSGDLARVASTYLVGDNLRLVVTLPKGTAELAQESKDRFHQAVDQLGSAAEGAAPDLAAVRYEGDAAWKVRPDAWGGTRDAVRPAVPVRTDLDNGVTVLVTEDDRLSLSAISLQLPVGSADDPPGKEGAAAVLGRVVLAALQASRQPGTEGGDETRHARRGRAPRPGDVASASVDVIVNRDLTELRLLTTAEDVAPLLEAVLAAIRAPSPTPAQFEEARRAADAARTAAEDEPARVAEALFRDRVYPGHPYAHPVGGTATGLKNLTRDDVTRLAAQRLGPRGTVLSIAGQVSNGDIMRLARRLLGGWKTAGASPGGAAPRSGDSGDARDASPAATARARSGESTRLFDAPHSLVLVGVPGVPVGDADFETLRFLGSALTMKGFEEMVFARRAAFTLLSLPEGLREGGALAIEVEVAHLRRDEAVFDVQKLMREMALQPMSDADVADVARFQAGRSAAATQGVLALASAIGYRQAAGLDPLSYRDDLIAGPHRDPQKLQQAAARYLGPEHWIVVRVGPSSP
jgi:zinc protease